MSAPGTPGSSTIAVSGDRPAATSRWAWTIRGLPAEHVLVVLLDAVLALALAVDEAEQVGRERRVGAAAGLRVDADAARARGRRPEPRRSRAPPGSARRSSASRPRARTTYFCRSHAARSALGGSPPRRARGSRPARRRPRAAARRAQLGSASRRAARARPSWPGRRRRSGRRCRRAGSASPDRIVVWANASPARRSRWTTCQYASRATSDAATTTNATSRTSRRRARIGPSEHRSLDPVASAAGQDERARPAGRGPRRSPACGSPARGRGG